MENKKISSLKIEMYKFKKMYDSADKTTKRNITRFMKQINKQVKQIIYASSDKAAKRQSTEFGKQLLNAGSAYTEEKNKPVEINKVEKVRERNKYEKGEALGAFKVVSYTDNLYYFKTIITLVLELLMKYQYQIFQ